MDEREKLNVSGRGIVIGSIHISYSQDSRTNVGGRRRENEVRETQGFFGLVRGSCVGWNPTQNSEGGLHSRMSSNTLTGESHPVRVVGGEDRWVGVQQLSQKASPGPR